MVSTASSSFICGGILNMSNAIQRAARGVAAITGCPHASFYSSTISTITTKDIQFSIHASQAAIILK
jgi:hypothetical protein